MFRKKISITAPPEWMIVGLGNPGPEYKGTRHNVGFAVIDMLSEKHRIPLDRSKHKAKYGVGVISDTTVLLVKPLTYMNLSGQAVAPLAREYNLKPDRILVIADDLDLPVGKNRLRAQGSSGGHNGHKSLIHTLGTQEYPRLKVGIGSAKEGQTIDHVLGSFKGDERDEIADALKRAATGTEQVLLDWNQALQLVNAGE